MPGTRVRYEIINRLFRGRPATHGESALRLDTRNRLHNTGVLFRDKMPLGLHFNFENWPNPSF